MKPQRLGPRRTFGFGDRFGFAGPAALAALRESGFASILAQQSPRELAVTGRTPTEVIASAGASGEPWGADADAVTTAEAAREFIAAGFTRLTIDPAEFIVEKADDFSSDELSAAGEALIEDGVFPAGWLDTYPRGEVSPDDLRRVAVKLGWAVAYAAEIVEQAGAHALEIEFSFLSTSRPTTPLEHWFAAQECRRRGLDLVAVAPRLPGDWETMAEYEGDLAKLEESLKLHAEIAAAGSHQIAVAGIECKDAIFPLLGRVLGERLHVKTSAVASFVALREIARRQPPLFREILRLASERFPLVHDRRVSLSEDKVRCLPEVPDDALEATFLGDVRGRQLLETTIGSLWGDGAFSDGILVRERLGEFLRSTEYAVAVEAELRRILSLLSS